MPAASSLGASSVTVEATSYMDFWSDIDDLITLATNTTNVVTPNVVVSNVPATDTIIHVIGMLNYRELNDTSTAENAINGSFNLKVKKSSGSWGSDDVALINIVDNTFRTAGSGTSKGQIIYGDNDVVGEVDANATYNFRFDGNAFVDGNNLLMRDVQVGLRVYFS